MLRLERGIRVWLRTTGQAFEGERCRKRAEVVAALCFETSAARRMQGGCDQLSPEPPIPPPPVNNCLDTPQHNLLTNYGLWNTADESVRLGESAE